MKTKKQIQGKKSRQAGARFELKVRKDLEDKGWVVDKWSNNVEFNIEMQGISNQIIPDEVVVGKLVKVKNKFLGPGKPMMLGAGFPDYIAFKPMKNLFEKLNKFVYDAIGVECRSKGYLTKEEKAKAEWYLKNKVFSKFIIAKKGKKRGEIEYMSLR